MGLRNNDLEALANAYTLINEGVLDKIKAVGSGLKAGFNGALKSAQGESTGSVSKDISNVFNKAKGSLQYGKSKGLVASHVNKLNSQIDDFINDLKSAGKASPDSEQNFQQTATFLKGIISEIGSKVSGTGTVTVADLKSTLSKAGFLA